MKPVFIYALLCPISGQPRYVGQTDFPDRRLRAHFRDAAKLMTHCGRWITALLANHKKPVMEILDVVPDDEANFWEKEYIQTGRALGWDLTNLTDGGDGGSRGVKRSPEIGRKISATKSGVLLSPEHCFALSASHLGNRPTEETRRKMSAAQKTRREKEKLYG